jgi:hypothetical protein
VVALITQNDLRKVQNLPFCYLCGKKFLSDALTDRDHVPPESVFAKSDRQPVVLKTHEVCNHRYSADDEKVGQLVALKHGKAPAHPQNRRLQIVHSGRLGMGAVSNLNVEQAIWGWIAGFHAALYGEPLLGARGSIVTPFPRADLINGRYSFVPLLPQHFLFVQTIKEQRMRKAPDRISANNGKLVYECTWGQADDRASWLCIFALDIYDWKDLGGTPLHPARGCAGCYRLAKPPPTATTVAPSHLVLPNYDPFDPFAA